jgi:hypothetical protein
MPRPGWAPDPLMVGIRSPDWLVVGSCASHPGVLGSIPKREEPGKTGRHPVLKYRVPHGSHAPSWVGSRSPDGWDQFGSDPPMSWWLGLAPSTLEFWVRFPTERNQRKTGRHPVFKYRVQQLVPHGSHAPPWVGSRSPDGWDQIPRWAGGWVLRKPPWSVGFDSQTRGTRENRAPPCVKVPGSSRVPPPHATNL